MDLGQFIIQNFEEFLTYTAFANATIGNLIMIVVVHRGRNLGSYLMRDKA